ncbi:hypothetical protein V8E53_002618 [Lactarius tabidus]
MLKVCQSKWGRLKRAPERQSKAKQPNRDLCTFFKARVPLNPPTVIAPPPIHTDKAHFSELTENLELELNAPGTLKKGVELLNILEAAVTRIPDNVPLATPTHQLGIFSVDPRSWVASLEQDPEADFEDDWMTLNSMLKTAFGWGELEMQTNMKEMLNQGKHSLDGFIKFFKYFVFQQGLEGVMIEPKINGLLCEIDNHGSVDSPIVLDHSPYLVSEACSVASSNVRPSHCEACCEGIPVKFPHRRNHHISYPFGIHSKHNKPWDYCSTRDKFYIQAKLCCKPSNTPLIYHRVGGLVEVTRHKTEQVWELQLTKLNACQKLLGKATALDNHKQWMMAIASGIKTLIYQYEHLKGYSNEDLMHSIVMLRLGGACVAEFAHRSLSLLGITTIRHNTVLLPLTVSPAVPTLVEIEQNITVCHSGLAGINGSDNFSTNLDSHTRLGGLVHQVLMFDELAIEQHVHWDDLTNKFLGICREHSNVIPLEFTSERELDILCDVIGKKKVHLATLSEIPHEYSVRPIMFAGPHHACIIQMVLDAANNVNRQKNLSYYGEAKRGDTLLSRDLPIYKQLALLMLMNHLDYKHMFKHQRNLLMRHKGVLIQGFCAHLESNSQDIVLAYSLLKEICPSFARAQEALNIYGQFVHHLMMPYICLIHLSAAAHMAFFLYRDGFAHTQFMPMQSYVDIMIMVKNVFYCVAKAKVDNPHSNFYPILLGTDCLETFFGLIRTAVGTDTNINILQLGSRASGLTKHPEWDLGTHCLMLPCITKDDQDGEITSKFDHISPKDWHGDASIARQAITCIPDARNIFKQLLAEDTSNIDMLSLLGTLLNTMARTKLRTTTPMTSVNNFGVPLSHMHEGDMEDAIADEVPRNNVDSSIIVQGLKTSKAKALRYRMAFCSTQSSTDWLKRVQNILCFGSTTSPADPDPLLGSMTSCDNTSFGAYSLLHLLADPMAKVDCQLLHLVPTTVEDDPTHVHDWCWSMHMEATCENVDGRYIHLLNPAISVIRPGKPTFLFEGSFLVTLSCSLFQDLQPQDYRVLPVVRCTEFFPYHFEGMLVNDRSDCSRCGPSVTLNWKNAQHILKHMGAHIQHDGLLDSSKELCGLCLRPTLMCQLYLQKARGVAGSVSVDWKKSNCINLIPFNYTTASTTSERRHRLQSIAHFPITISLSQSKKHGMFKVQRPRKSKLKNKPVLTILEAHHAKLYLHSDIETHQGSSGVCDSEFRGSGSSQTRGDAMVQEFDKDNNEGESDDDNDNGDGDGLGDNDSNPTPPPLSPTWYLTWSPSPHPTPIPTHPPLPTENVDSVPPDAHPAPIAPDLAPEPLHEPLVQASTFPTGACALESILPLSGPLDLNMQPLMQPPELTAPQATAPQVLGSFDISPCIA